jgi:nucleoside-diphosphate-sugar epimerase
MMKILVLGATGATGSLVVKQIVDKNLEAKIVVRDIEKVAQDLRDNNLVECVTGNITEFSHQETINLVKDCNAVISCLGHNITFKGIFGKPRLLVTDSVKNICRAINENKESKVKFILMNTTACINKKIKVEYSLADRLVLSVLGLLVPPQKDNVRAAMYLWNIVGRNNPNIEWTAVRPDGLINEENVSRYEVIESPKRSPVFDPGKTSRINVSRFMIELLTDEGLWESWKYKMPVIYNIDE